MKVSFLLIISGNVYFPQMKEKMSIDPKVNNSKELNQKIFLSFPFPLIYFISWKLYGLVKKKTRIEMPQKMHFELEMQFCSKKTAKFSCNKVVVNWLTSLITNDTIIHLLWL